MSDRKVKSVTFKNGVDQLGSRLSLRSDAKSKTTLIVTDHGIEAYSGKTGRMVLVPWDNIKGVEYEKEMSPEDKAKLIQDLKAQAPIKNTPRTATKV